MVIVDHTADATRMAAAASRARLRKRRRIMAIIVSEPMPGWKGNHRER
jgi:hypothetical protein